MKVWKILLMGAGFLSICLISIRAVQEIPQNEIEQEQTQERERFVKDYKVVPIEIPKDIEFAGEPVPLESPDIYERLDRELLVNTYWQSNALLLMKRANKYFPIIEPILEEYGVPEDLKYIAVIESGLTHAVSPAGARGFWQFMEATGREYGLEINDNIDERYHIEKATRAAIEYLKKSKERFGSWTLAAAAYNRGNYGISHQLERQEVDNYYELLLGEETGRYVFRILALKEIMTHPEKYGFYFEEEDLYQPIPTYPVEIDTSVSDFAKFAKDYGINYKILKIHNPWLREAQLENSEGFNYTIKIPEEGSYPVID